MRRNQAKDKMLAGKPAIGAAAVLAAPWAAGALSKAGYDWVLLDTQHALWSADTVRTAVLAILQGSAVPMARVLYNDYPLIGRLLDDGMLGVVVPLVNTEEEAEAAAYAMRYPPEGGRSLAGTFITAIYGPDYATKANDEVFLAVQIESITAVENAEAILSVDGVDGCWIGPSDLALSMGLKPSDAGVNKAHTKAVNHVLAMCKKTGKLPGYACPNLQFGIDRIREGFQFVTIGADSGFVAEGAATYLKQINAAVKSAARATVPPIRRPATQRQKITRRR